MTTIAAHSRHVLILILVWLSIIAARICYVQLLQHHTYTQLAERQAHITVHPHPQRAQIFDRHGTPLVWTAERSALCIAPVMCHAPEHLREVIAKHFPDRVTAFDEHRNAHSHFMYLRRHPSEHEYATAMQSSLHDLFTITEYDRYVADPAYADIVGHTDSDTRGISGLEYACDHQLRGTPGIHHVYRDARSSHRYFYKEVEKPYHPGTCVHTTLDAPLQFLVHNTLSEHRDRHNADLTAAVVMDPQSGDIRAIGQSTSNPEESFMPITQTYELGSVIKAFTITAALAEGVTTPDEMIDCEDTTRTHVNGMPITTWQAHGTISSADVIRVSNNIGTAKLAQRMGTSLYTQFRRFALDQKTEVTFPGEPEGYMTPAQRWSLASPLSLSFGYEIRISLLQLARSFSLFANNGHIVQPRITDPDTPNPWSDQRVDANTVKQVRSIIDVDNMKSTGRRGQIPGYAVYGKTGSAHLISNGTYDTTRGIYTFAGLIEKDGYQRVIITCVREPHGNNVYAATVAVPLFKRIAEQMLVHEHAP